MTTLRLRGVRVDLVHGLVERDGEVTRLTSREAALLRYLAARPGRVVSRNVLLMEVWGYAESVVSRAVDKTVTRLRARIERDRSAPEHLLTEYGVGFRFVFSPEEPPQPRRTPAPRSGFFGRDAEVSRLRAAVRRERLVSVVGLGGIGKSHLVAEALPGAPTVDADQLSAAELDAAVRALLQEDVIVVESAEVHRRTLVGQVPGWLRDGRASVVLTSQRPLLLSAERVLRLGPLEADAAEQMLCARAARRSAGWGTGEPDAVAMLCEAVGGWPLAIEHLAVRARLMPPRQLAKRFATGIPLDASGLADFPPRHQSLRASLERTLQMLPPAALGLARQLAIFQAATTLDAVQAVVEAEDLFGALENLSDWGVLWVSQDTEQIRLELFGPLRELLRQQLQQPSHADLVATLRSRHLAYFACYGDAFADIKFTQPGGPDRMHAFIQERANLEAALLHAVGEGDIAAAISCGLPLLRILARKADLSAMDRVLKSLQAHSHEMTTRHRLWIQIWGADLLARRGAFEEAIHAMRAARQEAIERGFEKLQVDACLGLALLGTWSWEGDAEAMLEEALSVSRRHGAPTALLIQELAWWRADIAFDEDTARQAEQLFDEARRAALAEDNRLSEGMVAWGQASLAHFRGENDRAAAMARDALPILVEMGRSPSGLHELQGRIALAAGQPQEAARLLRLAFTMREREGFRVARTLGYLAVAALAAGEDDASSLIVRAERLARQSRKPTLIQVLYQRGLIELARGDREAARRSLAEADEARSELRGQGDFVRIHLIRQELVARL